MMNEKITQQEVVELELARDRAIDDLMGGTVRVTAVYDLYRKHLLVVSQWPASRSSGPVYEALVRQRDELAVLLSRVKPAVLL